MRCRGAQGRNQKIVCDKASTAQSGVKINLKKDGIIKI